MAKNGGYRRAPRCPRRKCQLVQHVTTIEEESGLDHKSCSGSGGRTICTVVRIGCDVKARSMSQMVFLAAVQSDVMFPHMSSLENPSNQCNTPVSHSCLMSRFSIKWCESQIYHGITRSNSHNCPLCCISNFQIILCSCSSTRHTNLSTR